MTTAPRSSALPFRLSKALALTAVLGLSVSLAACGGQQGAESETTAASSASASASATAGPSTQPAPASPSVPAAPTPSAAAPPAADGTPAAVPALCTAASLTGSIANGEGGAGQVQMSLVVTNTSTAACILDGYPGVSLIVAGTTDPIGEPAVRDAEAPSNGPITLAPGNAAGAKLRYTQAGNYQQCQRVETQSILVYPPSATDSLEISHPLTACSNAGINLLTIGAFQP